MLAQVFGGLDETIWRWWADLDVAWVHTLARAVSQTGTQAVLLPAAVFAGIAVWVASRRVLPAFAPWIAVQVDAVLVARLKSGLDIARPPLEQMVRPVRSPAFPSGHTANTTALLVAVAVVVAATGSAGTRSRVRLLALVGAVAMGWSRLALNVHWFSDVVGGWVLGAVVGTVIARLLMWPGGRKGRANGAEPSQ